MLQNGKKQTQANEEQHGQNLNQLLLHLRVLLHVLSPQLDTSYLVHAKISPEKGCHGEGWEFPLAAMKMSLFASVSSPVTCNHWGKFDLILGERRDEGSSFPSLPSRALHSFHHHSLALLTCLECSQIPQSPLTLGKASGGGSICLENIG